MELLYRGHTSTCLVTSSMCDTSSSPSRGDISPGTGNIGLLCCHCIFNVQVWLDHAIDTVTVNLGSSMRSQTAVQSQIVLLYSRQTYHSCMSLPSFHCGVATIEWSQLCPGALWCFVTHCRAVPQGLNFHDPLPVGCTVIGVSIEASKVSWTCGYCQFPNLISHFFLFFFLYKICVFITANSISTWKIGRFGL